MKPTASASVLSVVGLAFTLCSGSPALSHETPTCSEETPSEAAEPRAEEPRGWMMQFAPPSDFYPHYIADPIRSQSALTLLGMTDSEIPEAGDLRFGLRLGGRYSFVRWYRPGTPDLGFQLDFEGGFTSHFDIDNSLDIIGWDGFFGLQLSWKPSPRWAFRVGTLHDSAHVGDEYAERNGRRRVVYTRNELILGASYQLSSRWRTYGEVGWQVDPEGLQEPWRAQTGIEYMGARRFLGDRVGWYGALDLKFYEETDWDAGITGQIGFFLPTGHGTNRWRLALELRDGRSVLGEFFLRDERYLGTGLYFDF